MNPLLQLNVLNNAVNYYCKMFSQCEGLDGV